MSVATEAFAPRLELFGGGDEARRIEIVTLRIVASLADVDPFISGRLGTLIVE